MKMTSRERIVAAMKCNAVDYVPCALSLNPLSAAQRYGKRWNFPFGPSQREKVEYCVEELGTDPIVSVGCGTWEMGEGVSSRVWFDAETQRIHKVFATPAGEMESVVRYDEKWPHGLDIPFFTDFNPAHAEKFWIESEQDLECMKHILRPVRSETTLEAIRFAYAEETHVARQYNLATMAASIGTGLTGALQVFGPTNLCILMVEKPALVDSYLALEHAVNLRRIEIADELGVDIMSRNGFYETADFYSPNMLSRFLETRLRVEAEAIHAAGAVMSYTVNTGVMPMLDYLRRLDTDCLFSIDIAFKDHDFEKIVASQEGTKSFWIGPSSAYHLTSDTEITREAVRRTFEVVGKRGLILSPVPSLHSIMPWECALAMVDEWKKLR